MTTTLLGKRRGRIEVKTTGKPVTDGITRLGGARTLVKGAVAGAAATWVMERVTTTLYRRESKEARQEEERARQGELSSSVAARKMASSVGVSLDEDAQKKLGNALHWGLGIGAGTAYAAMRERIAGLDCGRGIGFGTAFFLLMDEGVNTALGFTPPPKAFPWQAHARGLAAHLTFGLITYMALNALDRVA